MKLQSFRGVATVSCPHDAPVGALGFVRDAQDTVYLVELVKLIGENFAEVRDCGTAREWRVRRESFRLQVNRA